MKFVILCYYNMFLSTLLAAGHVRLVGDARDEVGAVELFHPQTGWTGICADPDHAPSWLKDNQAAEIVWTTDTGEGEPMWTG